MISGLVLFYMYAGSGIISCGYDYANSFCSAWKVHFWLLVDACTCFDALRHHYSCYYVRLNDPLQHCFIIEIP